MTGTRDAEPPERPFEGRYPFDDVRPATGADLPAIRALQARLPDPSPALLQAVTPPEILVSIVDHDGESGPADGGAEGRVVGYLLALRGTESADAHVCELVVNPEFRREGRGERLFRALFADLAPGTRVTLLVEEGNAGARSLYDDLGFEVLDRRRDAYGSGAGLFMATVVGP